MCCARVRRYITITVMTTYTKRERGHLVSVQDESFKRGDIDKTRKTGQLVTLVALPLLVYFAWQDIFILHIGEFFPVRLAMITMVTTYGGILLIPHAIGKPIIVLHALTLSGFVAMAASMVYICLNQHYDNTIHVAMAANTLALMMVSVFLFSSGARRYTILIVGIPLAILFIALIPHLRQIPENINWLSNPLFVFIAVSALSFLQEKERRKAFIHESIATLRSNQMNALLDAITEVALMVDTKGRIVLCNQTAAERMGRDIRDMMGQPLFDLFPAGEADLCTQYLHEVFKTGRTRRFEKECPFMHADLVFSPVLEDDGIIRYVAIFAKDITLQKKREEELVEQALHDPLTGVGNRRNLDTRLAQAISRAGRSFPAALLYLDIDHFKEINDRFGHLAGDRVLKRMSRIFTASARSNDAVFRLGGDEFAILIEGVETGEALAMAQRLRTEIEKCDLKEETGEPIHVSISGGLRTITAESLAPLVIEEADAAMYLAKEGGRNRIVLHTIS